VTLPGDFSITSPTGTAVCRLRPTPSPVRWTEAGGARAYVPEAEIFGLGDGAGPFGDRGSHRSGGPPGALRLRDGHRHHLSLAVRGLQPVLPTGRSFWPSRTGFPPPAGPGRIIGERPGPELGELEPGRELQPLGHGAIPSLFGDGTGVVAGVVNRSFTFTTEDFRAALRP
jgi:hypothetical protein